MTKSIKSLFSVPEVELVYKNTANPIDRLKVINTETAYAIFLTAWKAEKIELVEQCYIMMLDQANNCLGISNIATGGVSACYVDPKIIFATALKANASKIIIAHNHPSGNLKPSEADIRLAKRFGKLGKALSIEVEDQLIITPYGFYSFRYDCTPLSEIKSMKSVLIFFSVFFYFYFTNYGG